MSVPTVFPLVGYSIADDLACLSTKYAITTLPVALRLRHATTARADAAAEAARAYERCQSFYLLRPAGGGAFTSTASAVRDLCPTADLVMDGRSFINKGGTELFDCILTRT